MMNDSSLFLLTLEIASV